MKQGTQLKTKTGPDKNRDEFYFLYDKPGGTKIGSAKEATLLGTYDRTEYALLTAYSYVKLTTPVKGYRYAYIRESAVFPFTPVQTPYYVVGSTSVNVRSSATASSSKNIVAVLTKNSLVGTSDGTRSNGFLFFTLAKGGTGWVSANYLTTTVPKGSKPVVVVSNPQDGTGDGNPAPVNDPNDQSGTEVIVTSMENRFGTASLSTLKWLGLGLIAVALGLALAKYYEKRKRMAKRTAR